jgi:hypothetical protein
MTTKQDRADQASAERLEERQAETLAKEEGLLEAVVADGVMSALGVPADFLRVSARLIRTGRYRVNVFAGAHWGAARVAHSFFVTADGNGRILASAPPVAREHPVATRG